MTDPWQKSKKRSSGKSGSKKRPLKNFTLYLDEGLDCSEVKDALSKANIKFISHYNVFAAGTEDVATFERIGRKNWARITLDRDNRRRHLERAHILKHKIRQFVFTSNLGGAALADLIVDSYPKMREFARNHDRPFVATVTKVGNIHERPI